MVLRESTAAQRGLKSASRHFVLYAEGASPAIAAVIRSALVPYIAILTKSLSSRLDKIFAQCNLHNIQTIYSQNMSKLCRR